MKYAIERIDAYKQLLVKEAKKFYVDELSDDTIIAGRNKIYDWKGIKNVVLY